MKRISIWLGVGILAGAIGLTGCGRLIDPVIVLNNMMEFSSGLKQVEFNGKFDLSGDLQSKLLSGLKNLSVASVGRIDFSSANDFRYGINLIMNGQGSDGNTRIGVEVRGLPEYNYFKLTDIIMPLGLPFSLSADNKWYKVKKAALSNESVLGRDSQPLQEAEIKQIRNLVKSNLAFIDPQSLPDAVVNNLTTYHIKAKIDPLVFADFLSQLAQIISYNFDQAAVVSWANESNYEFWVTKRGFNLVRLKIDHPKTSTNPSNFTIDLQLTKLNLPINIETPSESVPDFNLDKFLGLPLNQL